MQTCRVKLKYTMCIDFIFRVFFVWNSELKSFFPSSPLKKQTNVCVRARTRAFLRACVNVYGHKLRALELMGIEVMGGTHSRG